MSKYKEGDRVLVTGTLEQLSMVGMPSRLRRTEQTILRVDSDGDVVFQDDGAYWYVDEELITLAQPRLPPHLLKQLTELNGEGYE